MCNIICTVRMCLERDSVSVLMLCYGHLSKYACLTVALDFAVSCTNSLFVCLAVCSLYESTLLRGSPDIAACTLRQPGLCPEGSVMSCPGDKGCVKHIMLGGGI